MQRKHDVNTWKSGWWPSSREVSLRDEKVICKLAPERSYDLIAEYPRDPHLQFIGCDSDRQLLTFVKDWGPLSLKSGERTSGESVLPLNEYRCFQRWLKALVNMLSAFKCSQNERESLEAFSSASLAKDPDSWAHQRLQLEMRFGIREDVFLWAAKCDLKSIRAVTGFLLGCESFGGTSGAIFNCSVKRGRPQLKASWDIKSLEEALGWMVWYDEFTRHPLHCCQECRKVFRSDTAHQRRYCSYKCGHRAASRKSQRKRRSIEKENHGAHKTR